jgi:hypothetical protein
MSEDKPAGVKKVGIAIDTWKLPIFSRILVEKGYHYTEMPGLSPGTLFLTVLTDNAQALGQTILACNKEAARTKGKRK